MENILQTQYENRMLEAGSRVNTFQKIGSRSFFVFDGSKISLARDLKYFTNDNIWFVFGNLRGANEINYANLIMR
jgi:hypothetical protein